MSEMVKHRLEGCPAENLSSIMKICVVTLTFDQLTSNINRALGSFQWAFSMLTVVYTVQKM